MFKDEKVLYTITKVVVVTVFPSLQIVNRNMILKSLLSLNINRHKRLVYHLTMLFTNETVLNYVLPGRNLI